jgi:KipI family sensor histidine kinase inhibitor
MVKIPTLYGGEMGPDLVFVAEHNGISIDEVIKIHSGAEYRVYMLGFSPGFPYLGGMPKSIETPRLSSPRTVIPAGSVGIAEKQTGIYPNASPGGWRLIGQTPIRLFDPETYPPALLRPGDQVQFVPIDQETFDSLQNSNRGN